MHFSASSHVQTFAHSTLFFIHHNLLTINNIHAGRQSSYSPTAICVSIILSKENARQAIHLHHLVAYWHIGLDAFYARRRHVAKQSEPVIESAFHIIQVARLGRAFDREDDSRGLSLGIGRSYPFPYLKSSLTNANLRTLDARPGAARIVLFIVPTPAIYAISRVPIIWHFKESILRGL